MKKGGKGGKGSGSRRVTDGWTSGLYMSIHKKRRRIAAGSGEKMRKPGSKGAPTEKAFRMSKRTAKKA